LLNVAYSEIMMKGGNRRLFVQSLVDNMLASLSSLAKFKAKRLQGRVILTSEQPYDSEAAMKILSRTFGVSHVSAPMEAKKDIADIEKAVLTKAPALKGKKIKVATLRSDKAFPMKSQEINTVIGKALVDAGCGVDLKNPEATVFVEILKDKALIFTEKLRGPGGLPIGSSGRLLSLLSGGIDSPASSWLMMKRGCTLDFLHLHQSASNKDVVETKMKDILSSLARYSPKPLKLYTAPYMEFYKKTMEVKPRIELILFRRFLFHLCNRLAEKRYWGVVTGDSVGQVASQTLGNLFASDEASSIPVYRPLAGYNKQEIVDLAKKIGTYELSIKPYKDCCSLVAHKSPSTKVPLALAKKAEEEMGMQDIVDKTLEQTEVFEVTS